MSRRRLYLAPCASSYPRENFERTIAEGVPRTEYQEWISEDYGDSIRVWGVTSGLEGTWKGIEEGDYLLFYFGDLEYRYAAKVLGTGHHPEWSRELWPDYEQKSGGDASTKPYEYLIFLEAPFEIEIDSRQIQEFADYGRAFPQNFQSLNERGMDQIESEYGSVEAFLGRNDANVSVWIEKTEVADREYKQSGPLALGNALIAPSRDQAGRKRYETLREAEVGDLVLHLLQEEGQIVGVSRIDSALQEDFEGPPHNRWTEEQEQSGGYLRELERYTALDEPLPIYDRVLDNDRYRDELDRIRKEAEKIVYDKNFQLNQGHYFTRCPDRLVSILAAESDELPRLLEESGYGLEPFESFDPEERTEPYETVKEATNDIRERIAHHPQVSNWLDDRLTDSIVTDWTEALSNLEPGSVVSKQRAVRFDQIRRLFEDNEARLAEHAEELGAASLNQLTPAETLFMVLLRDLQERADASVNGNQVKLNLVLSEKYAVEAADSGQDSEDEERSGHPLLSILESANAGMAVRKFTAPPDYWLTALRYGSIGLMAENRSRWEEIEVGDIVIFHSRVRPSNPELQQQQGGLIGAGIVGGRCEKTADWWWDELVEDATEYGEETEFPLLVSFSQWFLSGDLEEIDRSSPILEKSTEELNAELAALTRRLLPMERADDLCEAATGREFPRQSTYGVFRTDEGTIDWERPRVLLEAMAPALHEAPTVNIYDTFDGRVSNEVFDGLYFPDDTGQEIVEQITAALRGGKHIILTGPPGTGKTEVARQFCQELAQQYPYLFTDYQLTTATADWSTYDTVGGYMPGEKDGDEDLAFTPGIVLNRFKSRASGVQSNAPIIIDELNRADIDKAFGQLFTLLSGQSVQLPYTVEGQEVELLNPGQLAGVPDAHQYVVPESWPIFATMNTYDKTSLYEMSYAFMRRFAFVRISAPELPEDDQELEDLLLAYTDEWESIDPDRLELEAVGKVWREVNRTVEERAIGPAIVRDMFAYMTRHESEELNRRLTEAVIAFIFPQLEGVPRRKQIIQRIMRVEFVDNAQLDQAARDMLQESVLEDDG